MRALVVDDHPLIQEAVKSVLRRLDPEMAIDVASDCEHGLDIAQNIAEPDLPRIGPGRTHREGTRHRSISRAQGNEQDTGCDRSVETGTRRPGPLALRGRMCRSPDPARTVTAGSLGRSRERSPMRRRRSWAPRL